MKSRRQPVEQCIAWFLREQDRLLSYLQAHAIGLDDAELLLDKMLEKLGSAVASGRLSADDDALLRFAMKCLRRAALNEIESRNRRLRREREYCEGLRPMPYAQHVLTDDIDDEQYEARLAAYSLPPHLREALMLRLWQDLSFEQVADILELPVSTAKSRYKKALEEVEKALESKGYRQHGK